MGGAQMSGWGSNERVRRWMDGQVVQEQDANEFDL